MEKQVYLNKVVDIFEDLRLAIDVFNQGLMSDEEMKNVIRKAWVDKPKEWMLVDDDLAEILGLEEDKVGEVIPTEPYLSEWEKEFQQEIIDNLVAGVPNWRKDSRGRLSVCGSNSLIPNIIGEAEWFYCKWL